MFRKKSPEEKELEKYNSLLKSKHLDESLGAVSTIISLGLNSPDTMGTYIVSSLPKMLNDKNAKVHTRAAFIATGLLSISPEIRKELIQKFVALLKHKDLAMKGYAAAILGKIAEEYPEDLQPQIQEIKPLFFTDNIFTAWAASSALGDIGYRVPNIAENIIPFLDREIRYYNALPAFPIITYTRITLKSPSIAKNSISSLIDLLTRIKNPKQLDFGLEIALIVARYMNVYPKLVKTQLIPRVNSILEDKNPVARGSIVYLLGEIGMRQPHLLDNLLPQITKLCNDKELSVRALTALALARMSYKSKKVAENTVPALMNLLEDKKDRVRGAAAIGLRYIAASYPDLVEPVIPKLSKMLEDKDMKKRMAAGYSLQFISKVAPDLISDVMDAVGKVIIEGYASTRRGAGFALHFISRYPESVIDRDLLPIVLKMIKDGDSNVRGRGLLALKNMTPTFPNFVLEHIPLVLKLLEDRDAKVRMEASYALAEIADYHREKVKEIALKKIVNLLEDKEIRVRIISGLCLGRIS